MSSHNGNPKRDNKKKKSVNPKKGATGSKREKIAFAQPQAPEKSSSKNDKVVLEKSSKSKTLRCKFFKDGHTQCPKGKDCPSLKLILKLNSIQDWLTAHHTRTSLEGEALEYVSSIGNVLPSPGPLPDHPISKACREFALKAVLSHAAVDEFGKMDYLSVVDYFGTRRNMKMDPAQSAPRGWSVLDDGSVLSSSRSLKIEWTPYWPYVPRGFEADSIIMEQPETCHMILIQDVYFGDIDGSPLGPEHVSSLIDKYSVGDHHPPVYIISRRFRGIAGSDGGPDPEHLWYKDNDLVYNMPSDNTRGYPVHQDLSWLDHSWIRIPGWFGNEGLDIKALRTIGPFELIRIDRSRSTHRPVIIPVACPRPLVEAVKAEVARGRLERAVRYVARTLSTSIGNDPQSLMWQDEEWYVCRKVGDELVSRATGRNAQGNSGDLVLSRVNDALRKEAFYPRLMEANPALAARILEETHLYAMYHRKAQISRTRHKWRSINYDNDQLINAARAVHGPVYTGFSGWRIIGQSMSMCIKLFLFLFAIAAVACFGVVLSAPDSYLVASLPSASIVHNVIVGVDNSFDVNLSAFLTQLGSVGMILWLIVNISCEEALPARARFWLGIVEACIVSMLIPEARFWAGFACVHHILSSYGSWNYNWRWLEHVGLVFGVRCFALLDLDPFWFYLGMSFVYLAHGWHIYMDYRWCTNGWAADLFRETLETIGMAYQFPTGTWTLPLGFRVRALVPTVTMPPYEIVGDLRVKINGEDFRWAEDREKIVDLFNGLDISSSSACTPIAIPTAALVQPAKHPRSTLTALLLRTHKPPLHHVQWSPVVRTAADWFCDQVGFIAKQEFHLPDIAECAATMGGDRGRRLLQAQQDLINGDDVTLVTGRFKSVFEKTNETLKTTGGNIKPRAIVNLDPKIHAIMLPFARLAMDVLHATFHPHNSFTVPEPSPVMFRKNRYVPPSDGVDFCLIYAETTGEKLNSYWSTAQWNAANGIHTVLLSGDDSIWFLPDGRAIEGDYSMYDQTQGYEVMDHGTRWFEAIGLPPEVRQWMLAAATSDYAVTCHTTRGVYIRGSAGCQMPTGVAFTTCQNTVNSALMFRHHFTAMSTGQRHDYEVDQSAADFGFEMKVVCHPSWERGTFLKGWWVDGVWMPLPSQVLKLGKTLGKLSDMSNSRDIRIQYQQAAYALASSFGEIPEEYPILGPFLIRLRQLGKPGGEVWSEKWYRPEVELNARVFSRDSALAMICDRYSIEEIDVVACEKVIRDISGLPALFSHPVLFRLREVDYE